MTTHIRTITFTPIPAGASSTGSRDMRISLPGEPWHANAPAAETRKAPEPQFVSVIAPKVAKPGSKAKYGDRFDRLDEGWLANVWKASARREGNMPRLPTTNFREPLDLTAARYHVLRRILDGMRSESRIAYYVNLSRKETRSIVEGLEADGMVHRLKSKNGGTAWGISNKGAMELGQ